MGAALFMELKFRFSDPAGIKEMPSFGDEYGMESWITGFSGCTGWGGLPDPFSRRDAEARRIILLCLDLLCEPRWPSVVKRLFLVAVAVPDNGLQMN